MSKKADAVVTTHVGFTGTSKVFMTKRQFRMIGERLSSIEGHVVLHHGDCVNADAGAHYMAQLLGVDVEIHPPDNPRARAWCKGAKKVHRSKPYLERNHDIVDACKFLIAAPRTSKEEIRSGTWATIRYARKIGKPVEVYEP